MVEKIQETGREIKKGRREREKGGDWNEQSNEEDRTPLWSVTE